jgi:hypothetical protein
MRIDAGEVVALQPDGWVEFTFCIAESLSHSHPALRATFSH